MTATQQISVADSQAISLPKDISDFLQTVSECYGRRAVGAIMEHVSEKFLHQGMDRMAFAQRLKESFLVWPVDWFRIVVLRFNKSDERVAEVAGYGESNLGLIPATEDAIPLMEGSKLVLEHDGWKLFGNQSKSKVGLYKAFHQLSAFLAPQDLALYRSLVPAPFDVPPEPMISVKVAANERTLLPLRPYNMAHVQILSTYEGQQGWLTLTMPETDWMPVEMGKARGYPKYVADSIVLERSSSGWRAEVLSMGTNALTLSMRFERDSSQASWFERITSRHPLAALRRLLPRFREQPWFLIMPVANRDAREQVRILRGEPSFRAYQESKRRLAASGFLCRRTNLGRDCSRRRRSAPEASS